MLSKNHGGVSYILKMPSTWLKTPSKIISFWNFYWVHRYTYCQKAGNESPSARTETQRDGGCLGPPLPRGIVVYPRAAPLAARKHIVKWQNCTYLQIIGVSTIPKSLKGLRTKIQYSYPLAILKVQYSYIQKHQYSCIYINSIFCPPLHP